MSKTVLKNLDLIAQTIYDKKGFNILALDVRDFSTMTDFYVIAEGNIDRHVKSIAKTIEEVMTLGGDELLHIEGIKAPDWLVMDYGEIIIHLFIPELRERYALEQLWQQAKIVDLHINVKEN
ncbi:ribosome silencing factor [Neochlamydia sp. S13]|uniref:ribosome silencing factor n=1 Tax=Neochlamydia sp. S13 TaxID=1353976 RepID=UPI0005A5FF45|nr:ribosome silencing factor [Neochlamydia sp. S13]BBI17261.1 Ribosomal silencing factor RsfS [Neochlamydia sp. S13]BBI18362.1 Ribosomal silencing factor RsfS [Neochlamydia sp. S13]